MRVNERIGVMVVIVAALLLIGFATAALATSDGPVLVMRPKDSCEVGPRCVPVPIYRLGWLVPFYVPVPCDPGRQSKPVITDPGRQSKPVITDDPGPKR